VADLSADLEIPFDKGAWKLRVSKAHPTQNNGCDCGVLVTYTRFSMQFH
jgi:Ulp1 family protease